MLYDVSIACHSMLLNSDTERFLDRCKKAEHHLLVHCSVTIIVELGVLSFPVITQKYWWCFFIVTKSCDTDPDNVVWKNRRLPNSGNYIHT